MTWSLHPGAERDIVDAPDFYAEQAGMTVAERFLFEIERAAKLLIQHPDSGTPGESGRRTIPLQVFPYSIVYRADAGNIRILVVRHQHRKPGYGKTRR